jgi:hypothetical protein
MKLIDILKDLTYSELAGLNIGNLVPDEAENQPDPHQYEMIVGFINLGLKEIYKRFFLRSKEHVIQQHIEISTYKLHSDYAQTNTSSPIAIAERYIMDTADNPFQDDILKIEEVYDEEGNKLPINDSSADATKSQIVFTPTFRSLQISDPSDTLTVSVQYRACHARISSSLTMDPSTVEVELPNSLQEALLFYVASRAYRATNRETSADYWQLFKKSCDWVKQEGLEVQPEEAPWRFDDNGWV